MDTSITSRIRHNGSIGRKTRRFITIWCCFLSLVCFLGVDSKIGSDPAITLLILVEASGSSSTGGSSSNSRRHNGGGAIIVIGSVNADTFLPVDRLPVEGENLTLLPGKLPQMDIPGGKGCTQAVAASKLYLNHEDKLHEQEEEGPTKKTKEMTTTTKSVMFLGQFGADGKHLQQTMEQARVDCKTLSGYHPDLPSGRGYVFLAASTGKVSAVVSGGSNLYGWSDWESIWREYCQNPDQDHPQLDEKMRRILLETNCQCVMLQREVPEFVNQMVIRYCKRLNKDIIVLQDVGGEDRPMDPETLRDIDYLMPNESELRRLAQSFSEGNDQSAFARDTELFQTMEIADLVAILQRNGARNILVTQGSKGSTLFLETGEILHQDAFPVAQVVDETGAGDCYRAAFATTLVEGRPLQECMALASAAGACSVERNGAVPSTPTWEEVIKRLHHGENPPGKDAVLNIPRGDGLHHLPRGGGSVWRGNHDFPFLIGSRLNSMKDRPDLWESPLQDPRDYVRRQATVKGLTCVDFNFPQHFHSWSAVEAKEALDQAGLVAGAVCLRYPSKFARGAMNHPDPVLRREAIDITKQAAQAAIDLGCNEVVVWSAYDGYDYPFQVDYDMKWNELVEAFRECCDAYPQIKFSLEYKPTDENTRFFTVPSTGAALLLVREVDRANFGLTLDVGHMLMSGENPAQSIAMVGRAKKLFGIQLNDGYTRLAAEDGLMFGSIHPTMALEIMYQLHRNKFDGHMYFDTFPQRTDPVKEAEYNIARVKAFWKAACSLPVDTVNDVMLNHDAIRALELCNNAFKRM